MWKTGDRIADLETLSVSPVCRGGGIGSLIMETVLAELSARGIRDFQLGVLAANESAIRFYAKYGLTPRLITLSTSAESAGDLEPVCTNPGRLQVTVRSRRGGSRTPTRLDP
jgi:ribosomal protein S18 acetylase RimI-like enzyme